MNAVFALLLAASIVTRADADLFFKAARYPEAANAYLALLHITPRDAGLLDAMGQTLRLMRHPETAVGFFRAELAIEPLNTEARRCLGASLQESNSFDEARSVLEGLTASEPAIGVNWFRLGLLMYRNGYYPAAIQNLERALVLGVAEVNRAEVIRAISLLQAGRTAEAFQTIPSLMNRPENSRDLDLILSYVQILFEKGNYPEALREDGVALSIDANNANSHFWRARILVQQSNIQEAVVEAEKARSLAPASPAPRNLLIRLYLRSGRSADAENEARWIRQAEAVSSGIQTSSPRK